ncbi:MAG: adenylate/guanylate cyclase domain-containing protein [Comamonadaceae bacterium]|nr:adenylate/guanylate cyclase domain-containing protein [Burkholderiales bacterium]MEB2348074.1 adenylate/guanylate cyclase domain-containing protein [Comamonadaceae bacterium]
MLLPDSTHATKTVVFIDIAGSTTLYDVLGNAEAARAVTALTREMELAARQGGGRVIKKLGDGLLAVFVGAADATQAMARLMREQGFAMRNLPAAERLALRVGLATGEVLEVDGDCYGDAVNVAARLCERAGPGEIWATEGTVQDVRPRRGLAPIRLGHIAIRGKTDTVVAYQVEWSEETDVEMLTVPAELPSQLGSLDTVAGRIEFGWRGRTQMFVASGGPVLVGRAADCQMRVDDPRVSRLHARLDWRQGGLMLTDLSSFGTWVRFATGVAPARLRRDSCLLLGSGDIAMGVPFTDSSAPVLSFSITSPLAR